MSPGQSRLFLDQLPDKKSAKSAEKRRSYPAAFAKYRFYLDIRSARVKAALIEDILALGGVSSLNTGPVPYTYGTGKDLGLGNQFIIGRNWNYGIGMV